MSNVCILPSSSVSYFADSSRCRLFSVGSYVACRASNALADALSADYIEHPVPQPVFFCLFSFSTNLLWVTCNRYWIPEPYRLTSARDAAMTKGLKAKAFDFSVILRLPWCFSP